MWKAIFYAQITEVAQTCLKTVYFKKSPLSGKEREIFFALKFGELGLPSDFPEWKLLWGFPQSNFHSVELHVVSAETVFIYAQFSIMKLRAQSVTNWVTSEGNKHYLEEVNILTGSLSIIGRSTCCIGMTTSVLECWIWPLIYLLILNICSIGKKTALLEAHWYFQKNWTESMEKSSSKCFDAIPMVRITRDPIVINLAKNFIQSLYSYERMCSA